MDMPMETKALYDRLYETPNLKGVLSEYNGAILWHFHKYLALEVYTDERDTYIRVHNSTQHWHPDPDLMYDELMDIMRGNTVFISQIGLFGRYISCVCSRASYKKYKLLYSLGIGVRCISSDEFIK